MTPECERDNNYKQRLYENLQLYTMPFKLYSSVLLRLIEDKQLMLVDHVSFATCLW
jgi:NAD(P)H-dependent flavin oxidoreductase YrpB (nitropropane dioxygenase family)